MPEDGVGEPAPPTLSTSRLETPCVEKSAEPGPTPAAPSILLEASESAVAAGDRRTAAHAEAARAERATAARDRRLKEREGVEAEEASGATE